MYKKLPNSFLKGLKHFIHTLYSHQQHMKVLVASQPYQWRLGLKVRPSACRSVPQRPAPTRGPNHQSPHRHRKTPVTGDFQAFGSSGSETRAETQCRFLSCHSWACDPGLPDHCPHPVTVWESGVGHQSWQPRGHHPLVCTREVASAPGPLTA